MIEGIRVEWVEQYWPIVNPWVERAVKSSGSLWTADAILRGVMDRRLQMWVAWASKEQPSLVVITEVYETAAGLTCCIVAAGGSNLSGCIADLAVIEAWAKEQGCVRLSAEGRAGWERALKPHGWRVISTQVEKQLCPEARP